jgi:hypothetical protein
MYRNPLPRNPAGLSLVSICALILSVTSIAPAAWAQAPSPQVQGQMGQYPPGRPAPIAAVCQSELRNRVSADAGRRVNLNLDTQSEYSPSNGRQGLRGKLRYGIGGPSGWRAGTYDCVVDVRRNRVERATYYPRATSGNWPGGPGIPPRPGYPGGPGVPNYPRVKVDTSGRGSFNSQAAGNVKITRGFVDSTGPRPSVSMRGGNFMITFYGVVERSDGGGFTMRITGSDRGDAQGTAQARLNRDRNEVETITLSGRMGRNSFTGNFSR